MSKRPITPTVRQLRAASRRAGSPFFSREWMHGDRVTDYRTITHDGEVYLFRHVIRHPHSFAVWRWNPTSAYLGYCDRNHSAWEACWRRHTQLLNRSTS